MCHEKSEGLQDLQWHSEDFIASYMAAPSKGRASLVWDVVAYVIPFSGTP